MLVYGISCNISSIVVFTNIYTMSILTSYTTIYIFSRDYSLLLIIIAYDNRVFIFQIRSYIEKVKTVSFVPHEVKDQES